MRPTLVFALVAFVASPGVAQIPDVPTFGRDWTSLSFPWITWGPTEGLTAGLFHAQINQLGYGEWEAPEPYRAAASLDGHISASGSKRLELAFRAPKWVQEWRYVVTLEGRRDARERYFGIGNANVYDDANETDAVPHFYRSDNTRWIARSEVQRRVIGPLRLLAGLHLERWRIDTLSGPSQLAQDLAAGADPSIGQGTTDASARIGLVFDTRNDEPAPTRGLLIEAIVGIADSGIISAMSYTRTTVSATGYLPALPNLTIAARVLGQTMSGGPRLGSYALIEASDRPFRGIGSAESHRAIPAQRLLDADKLLANLDVRHAFFAFPTLFRVTAIGFLDAARVFPAGEFSVTTEDLMVGGGVGLVAQFFRTGILGTTAGIGPDGVVWFFHTRWPF
ncbi:MAG: outer membrane protein assembly factor [Gemmatimonadota bacterium]|nr:outer membrane protein assembly factor [Gemmatimonadota bacterium]